MKWLMNEADMNRMLGEICPANETYRAKAWGTILGSAAKVLALGALSNVYCYLGITDHYLVIAVLGTMDIDTIHAQVAIPLNELTNIKVRRGMMPTQKVIKFESTDVKMKISLLNNPLTAKIAGQKEAIVTICDTLNQLKNR